MASELSLIIFDCDGVLVDSEPLAFRVLLEGLAAAGHPMEVAKAYELFLGRSLANLKTVLRRGARRRAERRAARGHAGAPVRGLPP